MFLFCVPFVALLPSLAHSFTKDALCQAQNSYSAAQSPGETQREALDLFMIDLTNRGYEMKVYILNSAHYLLPQCRKMMFLVGLRRLGRMLHIESYGLFFSSFETMLEQFKASAPSLFSVLLPDTDAVVQKTLQKRLAYPAQSTLTSITMNDHRQAWALKGKRFSTSHEYIEADDRESLWWGTLCARKRACLDFHQYVRGGNRRRALASGSEQDQLVASANYSIVDLHKSIAHLSHGLLGPTSQQLVCTVLPDSELYVSVSEEDMLSQGRNIHRFFLGEEHLMLNGFPTRLPSLRPVMEEVSNNFLKDLGGNAFSSTIIVAILAAVLFAGDLRPSKSHVVATAGDAEDAMQLLQSMLGTG
jgi:hypothetical protein